ncbi:MAG: hypothetical protein ACP5G7_11050, partial [Anaerolineae bacterium]
MITLYVAPNGNDAWSGALEAPNAAATDGPLATLTGARDRLRQLRDTEGLPSGGAEVVLAPGDYVLDAPFDLERQDSGQPNAPIIFRGSTEGRARILGGRPVTAWQPVTDPAVLQR